MQNKSDIELGSVVVSKKGRDGGLCFAVVGFDEDGTVFVADGYRHKLNKPKRKNPKHLKSLDAVLFVIAQKIAAGKKVFDSELRSALKVYQQTSVKAEEILCQKTTL